MAPAVPHRKDPKRPQQTQCNPTPFIGQCLYSPPHCSSHLDALRTRTFNLYLHIHLHNLSTQKSTTYEAPSYGCTAIDCPKSLCWLQKNVDSNNCNCDSPSKPLSLRRSVLPPASAPTVPFDLDGPVRFACPNSNDTVAAYKEHTRS